MLGTICILVLIPFLLIVVIVKINQRVDWPWLENLVSLLDRSSLAGRRSRRPITELVIAGIVVLFAFIASARIRPAAPLIEGTIHVVADADVWRCVQDSLKPVIERVVRTPQPEKEFILRHTPPDRFQDVRRYRQLILIGTKACSEPMQSILERIGATRTTDGGFTDVRDRWSRGQLVGVLRADDVESLLTSAVKSADSIRSLFREDLNAFVSGQVFVSIPEKRRCRRMLEDYRWTMDKLADFRPVHVDSDEGLILFCSPSPHVWMFARWWEIQDAHLPVFDWIREERNRVTAHHYDSMTVADHYLTSRRCEFLGRQAIWTSGLWELESPASGGPFLNVTFIDPEARRLYMIDAAVFAPEQPKLPFLRSAEAVICSFRSASSNKG